MFDAPPPTAPAIRHDGWRFSVAPMMDWTDRHCRSFHRALSTEAWLYTEMVTAQAIQHGDREHLLGRAKEADRVVLQLGGADPKALADAARIGETFGYQEINLNCGCPSDRVREGAFGACLMADPAGVATAVAAMQDRVTLPVTVKHRIGIDRNEDYGFVRDFVGTVADAGCMRFIVHARNAWLDGLSPKENRDIPPLRYPVVHRLKADFPALSIELNGGLMSIAQGALHAQGLDGAMFGRLAYHEPWALAEIDARVASAGRQGEAITMTMPMTADQAIDARAVVVLRMRDYLRRGRDRGVTVRMLARHMLGLFHGLPGARGWRRMMSDSAALNQNDPDLLLRSLDAVRTSVRRTDQASDRMARAALT